MGGVFLALFCWLNPLIDERGEETGVPGENPDKEHQEMPQAKARKFKPIRDTTPHSSVSGRRLQVKLT